MNVRRLLRLAKHLRTGKLGHKKFDFRVLNSFRGDVKPYKCGYNGCAIGELPIVFPTLWKFDIDAEPALRGIDKEGGLYGAGEFFELEYGEVELLFVPNSGYLPWLDKSIMPENSTKEQVAHSIEKFIEWKRNGGTLLEEDWDEE